MMQRFVSRYLASSSSSQADASVPRHFSPSASALYNNRYQLVSQIGGGQHSTVWLATDKKNAGRHVAVKVLTNEVTSFQGRYSFELETLKTIQSLSSSGNPGYNHVLHMLDYFYVTAAQDNHLCIVTIVLGPTLAQVQDSARSLVLPLPLVKSVSRQLLQALDYLHGVCGIIHTDLKQDNIQFVPQMLSSGTAEISAILSGAPTSIKLIDFGTAFPQRVTRDRLVQPDVLRAPEVLLGCNWGPAIDIWNAGCLIFELLSGRHLFSLQAPNPYVTASQAHFGQMVSFCIKGNAEWTRLLPLWSRGLRWNKFYSERDQRPIANYTDPQPLSSALAAYGLQDELLKDFLSRMLRLHPDDRDTAQQLLSHVWLR